ncbi:hypothetical protein K4A83_00305 [Spirulina subsalsa FACHB-351]|uniref:Uncharacterized protein n=1 Tax=Spirulina subsalsa FACHB-351 TaxID=234711 RepID=A0ABT3L136_9CYAN|nr:hypothetical protein [Spirulina subsalsa]MCW6034720.1 hypothetical protein [Spirulina subsalsa FACHB-351]
MKSLSRPSHPSNSRHLVCLAGGNPLSPSDSTSVANAPVPNTLLKKTLTPSEEFEVTVKQLEIQGQRINSLAEQLAMALLDFKELATQVNQTNATLRQSPNPVNLPHPICQFEMVTVPRVYPTPQGGLRLTSRPLDLLEAEREAHFLAIALRQRRNRLSPHP